jgi:hypothetical protein
MDQVTIKDWDAEKAFINTQDNARQQACAALIASRVALRVASDAIEFFEFDDRAGKRDLTSVVIWRALLISGGASTMPTPDVKAASSASARAASSAASSAASFAAAAVWAEVTRDAALWLEHADPGDGTLAISIAPLWSDENPLDQDWHSLREKLRAADTPDKRGADWSFWIKWYDDILAGNPQNWKMLHEIATTPDIDWDASSREVNDKINGIVEEYRSEASEGAQQQTIVLLNAALANFEFNDMSRLMRMMPFEHEIRHLRDPEKLKQFLDDADELRDDMELLCNSMRAESAGRQNAGAIAVQVDGILSEFSRSRQMEQLRVGRIVNFGANLQKWAGNENIRAELGELLSDQLDQVVRQLLDMTHRHFSASLLRFEPLKNLVLEDDIDPFQLLSEIRNCLNDLAAGQDETIPGLEPEDLSVLNSMADAVEAQIVSLQTANAEGVRSSLKKNLDFMYVQFAVSVLLYATQGKRAWKVI